MASVLFALGLIEWRIDRAEQHLAQNVIDGLHTELTANLALIKQMQPIHAQFTNVVFSTQTFDPAVGRESAQVILALMRDLAAQEAHLIMEYREGLRRLEEIRGN